MQNCKYCRKTILFGGVRHETGRYCNKTCYDNGVVIRVAGELPLDVVQQQLSAVHQGACPKCKGAGPIDMHSSYKVWSLFVITSWKTEPMLSCRSCARKRQAGAILFDFVAGWWGFPFGLILTPVQISRNIGGMIGGPKPSTPSKQLDEFVRLNLAAELVAKVNPLNNANTPPVLSPAQ